MINWKKKFFFTLVFGFFLSYFIQNIYNYYFDVSIPEVNLIGIEEDKSYSGLLKCTVEGIDEYKVKNLTILLDDKIILNKHSVNSKSFSYPFSIPTFSLNDGKHYLKIIVIDSSKKENSKEIIINFNVDNKPLEAKLIKENDSEKIYQGNTLHITIQTNKENIKGFAKTMNCEVAVVQESPNSKIYECFIPVSTDEIPNEYLLTITLEDVVGNVAILEDKYQVISQNFKKQTIGLSSKNFENEPGKTDKELAEIMVELSKNSPDKKLWIGKFYNPCSSKNITTDFGIIRTSKEKGRYRHDAIDISAMPKSAVWACQDGFIVLKERFKSTGNTVVIDHGCGILSLYGHLENFSNFEVGDFVKKGNIIGNVGMTGYATGYHLHWEIRVKNINVNPLEWIKDDI